MNSRTSQEMLGVDTKAWKAEPMNSSQRHVTFNSQQQKSIEDEIPSLEDMQEEGKSPGTTVKNKRK